MERNRDSAVYAIESEASHLPGLYYLVNWKSYPEEKSTWESTLVMQHLQKLLSKFYWENPTKPTATSPPVDTALPMPRPIVKLTCATKQKRGRPAKNGANKKAKKTWFLAFLQRFLSAGLCSIISRFFSLVFCLGWEVFSLTHFVSFLLGLKAIFKKIFRFSSPVSHLDWEVFDQLIKLVFLLSFPLGFGRFFINLGSWLSLLSTACHLLSTY